MARLPDRLYHRAKREGFAARSVYKIKEIDHKYFIFRTGNAVLDLGCSPGSWLQYASGRIGPAGRLTGVDIAPVRPGVALAARFVEADVMALGDGGIAALGPPFDVVLSDLAPKTTGIDVTDCERSAELAARALSIAAAVLRRGGSFVCKVFQGSGHGRFVEVAKKQFREVRLFKPAASRKESREIYLIGLDFKGGG